MRTAFDLRHLTKFWRPSPSRTKQALIWAITWVELTKGQKVTEAGYKEFLAGIKRIEEGRQ